ncbi:MAG: hypothetical protein LKJ90_05455 [Faecalibacterium sp.]|jgi:hypothetical protein|nr:hypothetical protein [Faecalibacterium sp.]
MNKQNYSTAQRRALNQIWAAAGNYHFEPQFMALDTAGAPDFYMNCVIGFVTRWYGEDFLQRLFSFWHGDHRQAQFDDLAWLALENAVYEKELPQRPVLAGLRRAHAAAFFGQEYTLSRQQWMAKNQLVYTMQAARWHTVLGQTAGALSPWEKGLAAALCCRGSMDAAQLEAAVREILHRYFLFDGQITFHAPFSLHFDERWAGILTKLLPTEIVRTDELTISRTTAAGGGGMVKAAKAVRAKLRLNENTETDREYIEACFGRPLYGPRQMEAVERALCKDNHFGCHIWLTAGAAAPNKPKSPDSRRLAFEAAEQEKKNREAFQNSIALHQNAILRLTEQVHNCMLVHQQPQAEPARQGTLNGNLVWRAPVLRDGRVFTRSADDIRPSFAVDLLLDASASRLHCQETIAAQGYILAESLARCGIPVQVSSFCSLRGYTVLRVLKTYADHAGNRKIFGYFAAGWNRDGLALRAAGQLMQAAPAEKHLLILLTDASPNDSHKLPPAGAVPLARNYEGEAGVQDTAAEVRALRRKGVRVAAVFMGESRSIPDAETIFGHDLARIRRIDELAAAAGRLIQTEIQELSV